MPQWIIAIGRALIADDTVRAYVLAYVRHALGVLGAGLVTHGYVSNSMVQAAIGFVCAAIAFYGAHQDVSGVAATMASRAPAMTDVQVDTRLDSGTL
jgi:hypothetical protein